MRLVPLDLFGLAVCLLPADAARAAGCASLVPLHFPGGVGTTVLEGTTPRDRRACWTVHLEAGRRLDLRLTSAGGGTTVEVRSQAVPAAGTRSDAGSFASSSISSSSVSSSSSVIGSASGGETRLSIGPESSGGEVLIAVGAASGAGASYRLEVTLR